MQVNVGGLDSGLRIGAGLVILSLYFVLAEDVRLWALVGLVPLLTGLSGRCPLYSILGLNTCKAPRQ